LSGRAILPHHPRARRIAWFIGLWVASVSVALCVAGLLRWLFGRMLS
jgi:hypothetical protein